MKMNIKKRLIGQTSRRGICTLEFPQFELHVSSENCYIQRIIEITCTFILMTAYNATRRRKAAQLVETIAYKDPIP